MLTMGLALALSVGGKLNEPGWVVRYKSASWAAAAKTKSVYDRRKPEIENEISKDPSCKILKTFYKSVRATILSRSCSPETLERIKLLPDVRSVVRERESFPNLEIARSQVFATQAHALNDLSGNPLRGTGVKVGIIDTGIDYAHPLLGGCFGAGCRVVGGYDFFSQDSDPMDESGHGTHVASIAAGSGNYSGMAPGAALYALKVFGPTGGTPFSTVVEAIEWAMDPNNDDDFSDHLDVINLSLGADCRFYGPYSDECGPNDIQSTAINAAFDVGVVASISAGNSSDYARIGTPGVAKNAITVGAIDSLNQRANFSSQGPVIGFPEIFKPDVVAPGHPICAAKSSQYRIPFSACAPSTGLPMTAVSGTSMSAPVVAGILALLKQAHPVWTPSQLKQTLLSTADDLGMPFYEQGYGRVNALRGVTAPEPLSLFLETVGSPFSDFAIRGFAFGNGFQSWTLSLGFGENPTSWVPLASGNSAIQTLSVLSSPNLIGYTDGVYRLRLQALHSSGLVYEARSGFHLDHLEVTSPEMRQEFSTSPILIFGTAAGPGLISHQIKVYSGIQPTSTQVPLIITPPSSSPVMAGELARLDLQTQPPGYYTIDVVVRYQSQNAPGYIEETETLCIFWEPDLRPNFSKTYFTPSSYSSIKPAKVSPSETDLALQIPWTSPTPNPPSRTIFRLTSSAENRAGYPLYPVNARMDTNFASGDLNGDGVDELVTLDRETSASLGSLCVSARGVNGDPLWNTCVPSSSHYPWKVLMGDVIDDFRPEVIVLNNYRPAVGQPFQTEVRAFSPTGEAQVVGTIPNAVSFSFAIGDISGDARPEIIVLSQKNGNGLTGSWLTIVDPRNSTIRNQMSLPMGASSTIALARLARNENRSIIFVSQPTYDSSGNFTPAKIWVLNDQLSNRSGWPVDLSPETMGDIKNWGPSLGDLDGDLSPEIILTAPPTHQIYAFSGNGEPFSGFPLTTSAIAGGQVLVADADGDSEPDLIFSGHSFEADMIFAYSRLGTLLSGFPKQLIPLSCEYPRATPYLGDLDGDGRLDLASKSQGGSLQFASATCDSLIYSMKAKSWELPEGASLGHVQWGQFQADSQNSGCFDCANDRALCAIDINESGSTTVEDLFEFLALFFANDLRADFNRSGELSNQDIFSFLAAYFAGEC